jgi:TPR repeat protein
LEGLGLAQGFVGADEYFRRSAALGNRMSQYHYGVCLDNGRGLARDCVKAAEDYIRFKKVATLEKCGNTGQISAE